MITTKIRLKYDENNDDDDWKTKHKWIMPAKKMSLLFAPGLRFMVNFSLGNDLYYCFETAIKYFEDHKNYMKMVLY